MRSLSRILNEKPQEQPPSKANTYRITAELRGEIEVEVIITTTAAFGQQQAFRILRALYPAGGLQSFTDVEINIEVI